MDEVKKIIEEDFNLESLGESSFNEHEQFMSETVEIRQTQHQQF